MAVSGGHEGGRDRRVVAGVGIKDCAAMARGQERRSDVPDLRHPISPPASTSTPRSRTTRVPGPTTSRTWSARSGGFQVVVGSDGWITSAATTGSATVDADGSGTVRRTACSPGETSTRSQRSTSRCLDLRERRGWGTWGSPGRRVDVSARPPGHAPERRDGGGRRSSSSGPRAAQLQGTGTASRTTTSRLGQHGAAGVGDNGRGGPTT